MSEKWMSVSSDAHVTDTLMESTFNKMLESSDVDNPQPAYFNYIKYLVSAFIPVDLSLYVQSNRVNGMEQSMKCCLLNIEIISMDKLETLQKIDTTKNYCLAYKPATNSSKAQEKYISKRGLYTLNYYVSYVMHHPENESLYKDIHYTLTKNRIKELTNDTLPDDEVNRLTKSIVYGKRINHKSQELMNKMTGIIQNY
jgi:hypothetical protein